MPDRYFELQEAQDEVPWLKETFATVAPLRETSLRLAGEIAEFQQRLGSNGGSDLGGQLDTRRNALEKAADEISRLMKTIGDRGILIKDVDPGLVDFPSIREGREVYLCWREGEGDIRFWHDLDAGFAGRQPL